MRFTLYGRHCDVKGQCNGRVVAGGGKARDRKAVLPVATGGRVDERVVMGREEELNLGAIFNK